ncbi:MAG: polysaccharide biosynthesis tyrosine autokinase [Desulfatiglans sp.]|jgi:capsular exopolysaccharide synthesis family protein|nr:polysaccharide biosynthesis tyrosine autokinase [Thermodesulfobacteriota bacterium]MEE4354100.1 polysaccharide biosynthesis tyrosine autokinase [Desulfatiglans sp.]
MGIFFNALERHKKEGEFKTELLSRSDPQPLSSKEPTLSPVEEPISGYHFDPKLVVLSAPDSLDAEYFKVLRARILFPKEGEKPRTIMVTSAIPGEGKTFVSANLAAGIALGINEEVVLVDCDIRRPSAHTIMGYSNTRGLYEYLTCKMKLDELIVKTKVNKLSMLTAGGACRNPSELLSSAGMKDLLVRLKGDEQDRFVIVDAPPAEIIAEASVLANYVDAVILVIKAGRAPRGVIQKIIETIGRKKIFGVVFNGYSQSNKHYSKYYKGYYK